ncbi:hypothetical protein [Marivirga arenosa]|uniref:Uncharacterized protein n=1 Tax=Marivirga arenosa TaxID=3059076 RepID=A0AA49JA23_9BACT|nr:MULTISPECIES: hypothetical protein [unclassified Marivirga]WKK79692.2 hypothetical protein QYS47_20585 [Marivirga sp. BKB1-2]WKK85221.1 hypothetical protein QYS48_25075 [Marivirga sp. ABR2-2]
MANLDDFKNTSKKRMESLLSDYEALKAQTRSHQQEIQDELQEHIDRMDRLKNELEEKYNRIEHFGEIAVEELSEAFFTSAEAFSESINKTKENLK